MNPLLYEFAAVHLVIGIFDFLTHILVWLVYLLCTNYYSAIFASDIAPGYIKTG